ncbi:nucleoside deaminase [Rubrobacter tropicus]|uniref:Nucleoside deaminase n=1 Tax=Rubrobacter tropicus TaxID=2653851 RepID=A0A6G8QC00_9ACTN|nr:nucleoside deaminase [Rubrobacter tropicus]QIN83968.1 nucleoside deaminase [Rubrobacter tropicus]
MERTGDSRFPDVTLRLPGWVDELVSDTNPTFASIEDRMRFAVELSRSNVRNGTGGPFGAAVFERETGRLLAPGVNLVVGSGCSVFHAEMVAIMVAQKVVGTFDLGAESLPAYELVATTEPCAMCLGATPWSGVRGLVCGARDEDARAVGFDEGAKMSAWAGSLEDRGISVRRDVLRGEAVSVLQEYAELGGEVYNSRQGEREDPR